MFTRRFAEATLERALKTAAQSALIAFGADQFNAITADWATAGGFAAGGFVLSVLTSIVSAGVTTVPGPSLASERLATDNPVGTVLAE